MNDLYAAVVHDVKNQLAELALRLGKRDDTRQEVAIAISAAGRLSEMLLLHREAADQLQVNVDAVNPADFLAMLASEYSELFPKVLLQIDAARAPACAFFDDVLVRMALANALHNACRHARATIKLAAYEHDAMLVFEVADDGAGFPEKVLLDAGKSPAPASDFGTGLGLYLARKIAELHRLHERHGRIELSNVSGGQFRMLLP